MDAHDPSQERPPRSGKGRRESRATIQHRLEYAGIRLLGGLLRHLPVDFTSWAMGGAMGLVMPFTSRHKRALDQLAFAMPEIAPAERDAIARRMWRNLGRVSAEAFQIDKLIDDPARVALPAGFENYKVRAANGVIAATAHLGNWEIAGILARQGGIQFAGVYQALHNPYVERYLKAMRAHAYPAGLYTKGPELGHTLVRLAREGAGIGLVADFRELRGVPVTFFGQDAFGTPLPAMLARLTGRPLLAGAIMRTHGVHFRVVMQEIPVTVTDNREHDIAVVTQALHDAFEGWIREAPDQWMWTHRKWARGKKASRKDFGG